MLAPIRMTVAYLKKRMDGRFSRLSRDMNARFTGVDRRFVSVKQRFRAIDRRFKAVDQRFDAVDRRLNDMEASLRAQIGGVARQIESLGDKMGTMIRILDETVKEQGRALDEHEERLKDLERGYAAR